MTSPAPVRMSISSTDSCGRPLRNEADSIPSPRDRPAEGDRLQLRDDQRRQTIGQGRGDQVLVGAHSCDVGGAGSGSTAITPVSPEESRPGAFRFARARNRFDVGLANRTVAVRVWLCSLRRVARRRPCGPPVRRCTEQTQIYASPRSQPVRPPPGDLAGTHRLTRSPS